MDVTLELKKADVFTEVQKIAAYVASKSKTEATPDGNVDVLLLDADDDWFEQGWKGVVTDVARALEIYTTSSNIVEVMTSTKVAMATDKLTVVMVFPDTAIDHMAALVNNYAYQYAVNELAALWCATAFSKSADMYAGIAKMRWKDLSYATMKRKVALMRSAGSSIN